MQSAFLPYQSSDIHYLHAGKGHHVIFGLHGYGESGESFTCLERLLPAACTLIAPDFPFHGKTCWKEGTVMEVNQLATILRVLLDRHGNGQKNFTLLAFSMGARLALKLFEHFPDAINRLVLLAPDGLKMNRWYWLATQTVPGNRLFAYTMKNPGWFFQLMHFAAWMKLANSSIYKFTQQHINNPVVRKALFDRWTCMKKFTPSLVLIKKYIMQKKIPVRLLYGAHDRMIMPERGRKFMHGIETYCTLQVIDSGHQVLHEKNAKHIITLLEF